MKEKMAPLSHVGISRHQKPIGVSDTLQQSCTLPLIYTKMPHPQKFQVDQIDNSSVELTGRSKGVLRTCANLYAWSVINLSATCNSARIPENWPKSHRPFDVWCSQMSRMPCYHSHGNATFSCVVDPEFWAPYFSKFLPWYWKSAWNALRCMLQVTETTSLWHAKCNDSCGK